MEIYKRTVLGFYPGILNNNIKVEYIYAINKAYTYVILWLSASSMCLWFLI